MLQYESFWLRAIDINATFGLYLTCCIFCSAQMAELVDALGSGPSSRKGVWVRVPFWAQTENRSEMVGFFCVNMQGEPIFEPFLPNRESKKEK